MSLTILGVAQRVANELGLDRTDSIIDDLLTKWTNDIIQDVNSREDWPYLYTEYPITSVPDKTGGTVSVNANSSSVTGVGTGFLSEDVGQKINFNGSKDWYEIVSVTDLNNLLIRPAYQQTSNLSGGAYTLRHIYYEIPGVMEMPLIFRQDVFPRKLVTVNVRGFDQYYPNGLQTGTPRVVYLFGKNSNGNYRVSFYPYPDQKMIIWIRGKLREQDYTGEDVEPLMPNEFRRSVLVEGVKTLTMSYLNDPRFETQKLLYESGIENMKGQVLSDPDYHPIIRNIDRPTYYDSLVPYPQQYGRPI